MKSILKDRVRAWVTMGGVTMAIISLFSAHVLAMASANDNQTIIDEWATIKAPPPPELKPVTVNPNVTALLILDMQNQNCNKARRPRCVASLPKVQRLLAHARDNGMAVIYTLTSRADVDDIRTELTPLPDEPVVKASVDKFFGTELQELLEERGVQTVILVGTSAHGAVLHTATGAAMRGLDVIVPVDGMSAEDPYAEQYTAWHLANSPGTRRHTTLTTIETITI